MLRDGRDRINWPVPFCQLYPSNYFAQQNFQITSINYIVSSQRQNGKIESYILIVQHQNLLIKFL